MPRGICIKTPSGKAKWSTATIDQMLSNEKYAGLLIAQKTYLKDFPDGKQHKNTDEASNRMFENHRETIIESDIFEQVQQEK